MLRRGMQQHQQRAVSTASIKQLTPGKANMIFLDGGHTTVKIVNFIN
jgi:hypothetical protein